jgi:hypothetical protein
MKQWRDERGVKEKERRTAGNSTRRHSSAKKSLLTHRRPQPAQAPAHKKTILWKCHHRKILIFCVMTCCNVCSRTIQVIFWRDRVHSRNRQKIKKAEKRDLEVPKKVCVE